MSNNNKNWGFYGPRDDEYYHATYDFYIGDMDHHIQILFPNLTKEAVSVIDNFFVLFRSINNWPGTKGIGNMDSNEIINLVRDNPLIPDFKLRFIEAHKKILEDECAKSKIDNLGTPILFDNEIVDFLNGFIESRGLYDWDYQKIYAYNDFNVQKSMGKLEDAKSEFR